ncbi:flagellar hook protein FlgE [Paraburkholderia metrosideri]|jgi:flagellar hook protein FlgE|uniref:Flagellar hook protein FlgE n=1 Tax=Paraburkholderia metrosideri TaxID=580937 RepID=A0ABN7HVE0_9BURK|nr:flagellar hook protein FlgE [Paraburkholderia metrosideri]CAD6539829.1 hypothetical protein LMG28140_03421 [Paraburkholderia metrosideri]
MGYNTGLSGLSAASNDLDVIGNNIANANTVGFKSGTAEFADMYASSVATAVANQVGIGTQMTAVQQQFAQGSFTSTGAALNAAINGNGFYQMNDNGTLTYSRNGVFQMNKDGYITNTQGLELMGYAANSAGVINTAQTVPLQIPTGDIAPVVTTTITGSGLNLGAQDDLMYGTPTVAAGATNSGTLDTTGAVVTNAAAGTNTDNYSVDFTSPTSYNVTDTTTGSVTVSGGSYTAGTAISLGNGQTITFSGDPAAGDSYAITAQPITFNQNSSATYNAATSVTAYDSLGGSQQVNLYFAKTGSGTWDVYAGTSTGTASLVGGATFNSSGVLTGTTDKSGNPTSTPLAFNFTIPNTDGSSTPQALTLNVSGMTQYGGSDNVAAMQANGNKAGSLSNFSIDSSGTLTGTYSNGATAVLGQIALANFTNPNGLVDLGNNEYGQTLASGQAQVGVPGSNQLGSLVPGEVEDSNVDLTGALVDLITAQRNYQANAQTIKTQQTVDQTLINL